ncbi:MAG: beta-ketoacyl-[acyl-carrier-protein] synthase II [Candidatus Cloacimonadota bacterium]|nr:MAG: beta-ketoacyl-[acyl-carrier-protein] synthase II [Candidatus Cloacimonadota bacterium]PIE77647.1 MAG: beta-ketoacyl-[acyl-carrier-protein] synthase II [Candidatus Delongbacteria bacterium]
MKRRVVVTGIGVISSVGKDADQFYNSLLEGKSGISAIERFDATDSPVKIAGEIKDFNPEEYMDRNTAKRMDRFCQFAIAASKAAIEDSGVDLEKVDLEKFGVITGSGLGGMDTLQDNYKKLLERGARRVSPLFIPMMISDIAAGQISMRWGLKGPNYTTTSACASSGHAIGNAFRTIQYGDADMMISGGAEAVITDLAIAGFTNMKALSRNNDNPEKASRPFDKDRDGFVMGEGSGMIVLEELEHAKKRGAKIYGEVVGFGFTADAHHITEPAPRGNGGKRAMETAMRYGNITPDMVDHINTHGTSTPTGDIPETQAIRDAFGDHAKNISINSTKSMIGHLLGAAGAVEFIATILATKTNKIHPTINLENQDPECGEELNFVPNKMEERVVNYALTNTFGFGGHNCSILVKKFES